MQTSSIRSCNCTRRIQPNSAGATTRGRSSIPPSRLCGFTATVFGVVVVSSALMNGCGEPAVAQEIHSLDGTTVNVRDFGAVGNGTGDDRPSIQQALNSGASFVFVPNGTYPVSAVGTCDLTIPAGVTLYGESRDGAILKQLPNQPANARLLRIGPCIDTNPPSTLNVTVHDLTLDGNKTMQTVDTHRAGIFAKAAPNVTVHDVTSINFTGDGFYFYDGTTPIVDHVLATSNNRDGLVVSGGVSSGSITNSTLIGNAVQQFDSEGGTEFSLVVTGNVFDGGGVSNDYAMTVSGASDAQHSGGWVIDHNTINGGVNFVWTSNMVFSNNTGVNPTTKPAVTAIRSNDGLVIRNNTLTNTQIGTRSSAVVYLAGTGVGALPSAVISDNTLIVQGEASSFGVRAEGCGTLEVLRNTIVGPGLSAPGYSGVALRASVTGQDFIYASVHNNVIRNWGALGVSIAGIKGNSAAILDVVDVSCNTFDDTAGTMLTALNLNIDGADAAKDVSVVSNTLSGGCTTLMTGTMTGTHQALTGDRWVIPPPP